MSQVFFDELDIPLPDVNLGVGSASHGRQTGEMLVGIEAVLLEERPDWVLVYGDTNSTLAGALAAAKLHIPVAHVEAGLRSFNRRMPEEINRVLTDHVADLLLCPTQTAVDNLAAEGLVTGVHNVGDVMYDAVLHNGALAAARSRVSETLGTRPGAYLLATLHRPRNTDDPGRLQAILEAFQVVGEPIVFPAHPRTQKAIRAQARYVPPNVRLAEPVGYLDMLQLERQARAILTDSGGVQKEAYFFGVPCITLREETEWVETVQIGWNRLVGADRDEIVAAVRDMRVPIERPPLFGDGHAAEKIVSLLD
jgi:UDP-N-acetylglucosamine 2-epimerase